MRCWDGHNTPDEMHRSSGEGRKDMAQEPGVVQRVQRGKGTKHGSRLGRSHVSMPGCPRLWPQPHGAMKEVQVLFVLGGLSQEGGVRVGFLTTSLEVAPNATPLVINNSQEKKEQSRGDRNERWDIAQRFTSPMLFSGPEKPQN